MIKGQAPYKILIVGYFKEVPQLLKLLNLGFRFQELNYCKFFIYFKISPVDIYQKISLFQSFYQHFMVLFVNSFNCKIGF
jgi:hypothetical protein